ncbi:MAG: hypothetical protein IMX01_09675 [Limnochordaceae bacterium]|nr:hypothetical protein [Limnochordaceae bacterium]
MIIPDGRTVVWVISAAGKNSIFTGWADRRVALRPYDYAELQLDFMRSYVVYRRMCGEDGLVFSRPKVRARHWYLFV